MNTILHLLTALIFAGSVLSGCGPQGGGGDKPIETAVEGTAEIYCDEEILELLGPAKALYDKANPKASVTLKPINAFDGSAALLRHEARAIAIARNWLPEEDTIIAADRGADGFPRTMIARDALVFYAAKSFPYDTLSAEDIKTWLKGGTVAKTVYPKITKSPTFIVPDSRSSVFGNLMNVVLGGATPATGTVASLRTTDSAIAGVSADPTLIGVGYLSQLVKRSDVKMLRLGYMDSTGTWVRPKPVHQSYLVMGQYPFPVPIYIALRDKAGNYNLPSGFMLFVARDANAQRTFLEAGIEPGYAKIELILPE